MALPRSVQSRVASFRLRATLTERGRVAAREAAAVLMLSLGALTTLSLLSYAPSDASLNQAFGVGHAAPENWIGPIGALWADLCLQVMGVAAWMFDVALLWVGGRMLLGRHRWPSQRQVVATAGLAASCGTLIELLMLGNRSSYPLGGVFGALLARTLRELFAPVGAATLAATGAVLSLTVCLGGVLSSLARRAGLQVAALEGRARTRARAAFVEARGRLTPQRLRALLAAGAAGAAARKAHAQGRDLPTTSVAEAWTDGPPDGTALGADAAVAAPRPAAASSVAAPSAAATTTLGAEQDASPAPAGAATAGTAPAAAQAAAPLAKADVQAAAGAAPAPNAAARATLAVGAAPLAAGEREGAAADAAAADVPSWSPTDMALALAQEALASAEERAQDDSLLPLVAGPGGNAAGAAAAADALAAAQAEPAAAAPLAGDAVLTPEGALDDGLVPEAALAAEAPSLVEALDQPLVHDANVAAAGLGGVADHAEDDVAYPRTTDAADLADAVDAVPVADDVAAPVGVADAATNAGPDTAAATAAARIDGEGLVEEADIAAEPSLVDVLDEPLFVADADYAAQAEANLTAAAGAAQPHAAGADLAADPAAEALAQAAASAATASGDGAVLASAAALAAPTEAVAPAAETDVLAAADADGLAAQQLATPASAAPSVGWDDVTTQLAAADDDDKLFFDETADPQGANDDGRAPGAAAELAAAATAALAQAQGDAEIDDALTADDLDDRGELDADAARGRLAAADDDGIVSGADEGFALAAAQARAPRPYVLPPLDLLHFEAGERAPIAPEQLQANAAKLTKTLSDYGIDGHVREIRPGPVVTLYEYVPGPGIKVAKIASLADDLAMSMEAFRVRIVAPIPGKGAVGIEIPNDGRELVHLKEILSDSQFTGAQAPLTMALGKDIEGAACVADLARMPHLLVAGATGAGKSVSVNAMIMSVLFKASPEEVRMIMVDPKMLELSVYEGIPHLLLPVVTDPKKAAMALRWAVEEMERRYELLSEVGVRSIDGYNVKVRAGQQSGELVTVAGADEDMPRKACEPLPYLLVVVDELADLMMVASREVEGSIMRLAQMARAAGIHLILATQRPSVDVLTGVIKANFPTRIAFQVASRHDSRTIIDANGAEHLLGRGDMLYMSSAAGGIKRVHGAYVSEEDIERTVAFVRDQGEPTYDDSILAAPADEGDDGSLSDFGRDEMYDQAVAIVAETRQASISMIQRRLRIGYNRAARMVECMEHEGIVGPGDGAKPREVFVSHPTA